MERGEVMNALGLGCSMLAGGFFGQGLFLGTSSSYMENVQQLFSGIVVGTIIGGVFYKIVTSRTAVQ